MLGISEYAVVGLVVAATGLGVWGKTQERQKVNAIARLAAMEIQLKSCAIQITDIREDLESDNAVDSLSDSDLINVPAHWLRGGNPGGK